MTARQWKQFYALERETLGPAGLRNLVEDAPRLTITPRTALIFPHTKLADSGQMPAAVARAVVESGCETVLAIGVLHGGREVDADLVRAARSGEKSAVERLRRVHSPGVSGDRGIWQEEFSLDGFLSLLSAAQEVLAKPAPRVVCRYPFLVGLDPQSLPGLDELRDLTHSGAMLVATTDPIHHGGGYGTATSMFLDDEDPKTLVTARSWVQEGFDALAAHDYSRFVANTDAVRSDFRDAGPVVAELLRDAGELHATIHDLTLVNYADALACPRPTWVAAALASIAAA